ncbi:MAG: hypothetical protein ACLFQU_01485 [Candidatus Kapaibacterium sp.]
MKRFLTYFIFLISAYSLTYADFRQSEGIIDGYRLQAGFGRSFVSAAVTTLPGIANCCPSFESGSGSFGLIGLSAEKPLNRKFKLNLSAGYRSTYLELLSYEPVSVSVGGELFPGEFVHELEYTGKSILFGLKGEYLFGRRITALLGINGTFAYDNEIYQAERLVNPVDRGVFIDTKTRIRNEFEGSISELNGLALSINAGLRYYLPLNENSNIFLIPGVYYSYPLTSISPDIALKHHDIGFELAIGFYGKGHFIDSEERQAEPIMQEKFQPEISFSVFFYKNGLELTSARFEVTRAEISKKIFFQEKIPDGYTRNLGAGYEQTGNIIAHKLTYYNTFPDKQLILINLSNPKNIELTKWNVKIGIGDNNILNVSGSGRLPPTIEKEIPGSLDLIYADLNYTIIQEFDNQNITASKRIPLAVRDSAYIDAYYYPVLDFLNADLTEVKKVIQGKKDIELALISKKKIEEQELLSQINMIARRLDNPHIFIETEKKHEFADPPVPRGYEGFIRIIIQN